MLAVGETGERQVYLDRLWPGGVIPYLFESDVTPENRDRARSVMDEIESWADVSFIPRAGDEPEWIAIRNSSVGNGATVGRAAGGVVNIRNWEWRGMILHELMHTLGFLHEQSRADRDQYIDVDPCVYANGNYNINSTAPQVGPYDFESVTHYTPGWGCEDHQAFVVREPYNAFHQSTVGTWHFDYRGPSNGDIWAMYVLYGGNPVPGPFRYASPAEGASFVFGESAFFSWEESGEADSYEMLIDRSPFFPRPIRRVVVAGTSVEIDGLAPGSYFWRCDAVNERGRTSPRPRPLDVRSFAVLEKCIADLAEPVGELDFADVAAFGGVFALGGQEADLADPEGVLDLADIVAFINSYLAGCY